MISPQHQSTSLAAGLGVGFAQTNQFSLRKLLVGDAPVLELVQEREDFAGSGAGLAVEGVDERVLAPENTAILVEVVLVEEVFLDIFGFKLGHLLGVSECLGVSDAALHVHLN